MSTPPRLLLATRNRHKAQELSRILDGLGLSLVTLEDLPAIPPVSEDAPTLEGNALKKARLPALASGLWTLADDTGLEVAALGGAPGVLTARFAGPGAGYDDNVAKLLSELAGVPAERRGACFRTVIALSSPEGRATAAEGRLDGRIAEAPRGREGFGYDPVFLVPELGRTLAELSAAEKDGISHRGRALAAARPTIESALRGLRAALALLALAALPAGAAKDRDPGQRTFWDEMMEAQAARTLRQGAVMMEARRYGDAVKEFARAVVAAPLDPSAHRALGVAYYWSGEVDRAQLEFEESLRLDPTSAQTRLLLGIVHAWRGDAEKAHGRFAEAAGLEPGRADIQMNLGSIEESLGKVPEALGHFREAVRLDPRHPLYRFQLGTLYRRLGRDEESVAELKEAIRRYPDYQDAILELGAVYERLGRGRDALDMFKRAVRVKSRDSVARFRLARSYLLLGRPEPARDALRGTFHLTPADAGGGLALSVAYGGRDGASRPEGGKAPGGPSPAPPPSEPAGGPLDVVARNLERIPLEQEAELKVDLAFLPRPVLTRAKSGEAPSALKRALERAGGVPTAKVLGARREYRLEAGSAEARGEAIKRVVSDLRRAMAEAPPDSETRFGMNLSFTGRAAARAPDGQKPNVSYNPHDVGNDLGLWVMGTGWMALVEEAMGPAEDGPAAQGGAAWWVLEGIGASILGDSGRAMAAFGRALELDPREELALLGRGLALVIAGDEAGARDAYRRALEVNPKNRAAAEGLKWLSRSSVVSGGRRAP